MRSALSYTRAKLRDAERWEEVIERHDRHNHDRYRALRQEMIGSGRTAARVTIEAELSDYEIAFDRHIGTGSIEEAQEMAWPLGHVWLFSGKLNHGTSRLEELIVRSAGNRTSARGDALTVASFLLMYVMRYDTAIAWANEAVEISRSIGDEQGLAYALARSGHLAFSVGDVPAALDRLQESVTVCGRIAFEEGSAWPLTRLAQARFWGGDESQEVRRKNGRRFSSVPATATSSCRSHPSMTGSFGPVSTPLLPPSARTAIGSCTSRAGQ